MLTKFGRYLGLAAAVGALALYGIFVWFNPYNPGSLTLPVVLRMLVGVAGLWVAYKAKPLVMLLGFVLAFVPLGLYMLGTPGLFRWIGVMDLVYLTASLMIGLDALRARSLARTP